LIRSAKLVIVRADGAAYHSMDSQRWEKGPGNFVCTDAIRTGARLEHRTRPANREDVRENAVVPTKILEDRVGQIRHHAAVWGRSDELHELLRIVYRQRAEQHGIHHAEEGGIGSNAQRERKDGHGAKYRCSR